MTSELAEMREAIVREDYVTGLLHWKRYAARVSQLISVHAASAQQMEEARELVEWSRLVLLGARAQLQARLNELRVAAAYTGRLSASQASIRTRV